MPLAYVTLTGDFIDGSGNPASGTVTLTASQTGYASGVPAVSGDSPIVAQIVAGQLLALGGGPLQVLATDNTLTLDGPTGWWAWTAAPVINGVTEPPWSFFLPSSPSSVPLWATRGTGAGGIVQSVTAGDASIVVAGTAQNPTVETGRLDQIASLHPATAAVGLNGQKVTSLANGAASTDAVAFGQLGTAAFQASGAFDASGAAAAAQAASVAKAGDTMAGKLAPKVVILTDAATIAVNASAGNEQRVTLGGNRTMGAPSGPADGQVITFELVQDATGSRTVTWTGGTGGYDFGSGSAPTLSTAAHAVDMAAFRYSAVAAAGAGAWCYLGSGTGF